LWSAAHQPTPHKVEAVYTDDAGEVQLYIVLFPQQRQGNEAINQQNQIAADLRRKTGLGARTVNAGEERFRVNSSRVIVPVAEVGQTHLVWQWYRVAGRSLTNRYEGKAWEAMSRIYPGRADGAWIAISTALDDQGEEVAEARLSRFARSMAPHIGNRIDNALGLAD
jgi:EpsI family protein